MISEGFLHPATMARSVYTAVAYAHDCCAVPIDSVLLYSQVPLPPTSPPLHHCKRCRQSLSAFCDVYFSKFVFTCV